MMKINISIAKDFSKNPGPQYRKEGNHSGQEFREDILFPNFKQALQSGNTLVINLDGTKGYGTSFLEEAFGGLIRVEKQSLDDINKTIELISIEEDYLITDIEGYLNDAWGKKNK